MRAKTNQKCLEGTGAGPFAVPPVNQPGKSTTAITTILVVDSELWVRELATNVIRSLGLLPLQAQDGDEALRVAKHVRGGIGLLLTGVTLPTLSGLEVAKRLRGRYPKMKVIYMSGPGDWVRVYGPIHPGSAPLVKPFTRERLAYELGMLLSCDPPERRAE
jgi:DNA-binding NtrC family response regulator